MRTPIIATAVLLAYLVSPAAALGQQPASKPKEDARKPIRVLYLEDQPRWDYRYIKNALRRTARDVDVQAFLLDASPDFVQEASAGTPPLRKFPTTREEFFAYDVILIGDISGRRPGMEAADQSNWMLHVMNFLDAGGGVAFLCGTKTTPEFYRGTILEHVLPVVLPEQRTAHDGSSTMTRAVPPASAPSHPITKLVEDEAANSRLWATGMAKLTIDGAVETIRKGATPVLVDAESADGAPRVIAATGRWGKGHTFYIGSAETWRWRNPHGGTHQEAFWRNVVRHLAKRHEPGK